VRLPPAGRISALPWAAFWIVVFCGRTQMLFALTAIEIYYIQPMLYFIGLGLADETDISVKGLEIVKKADRVYLEAYTSILLVDKQRLVCYPCLVVQICVLTSI
jgi:hypothetical protein